MEKKNGELKSQKKMTYFCYLRVSDDWYKASIETQQAIIDKTFAKEKEEFEFQYISEVKSWYKGEREKFNNIIKLLENDSELPVDKRQYKWVIVFKTDRLSRNDDDFAKVSKLLAKWYVFKSATETIENTPTWKMLLRILAAFAVYESERLSNRVTYAQIHNIVLGKFHKLWGNLPFWYKKQLHAIWKVPEEVKIINKIYTLYLSIIQKGNDQYLDQIKAFLKGKNTKSIVKAITYCIQKEFNDYLTTYLKDYVKQKNKKIVEKRAEEIQNNQLTKLLTDMVDPDEEIEVIEADSKDNDYTETIQWYSKEESLVYNILKNSGKSTVRYNGYMKRKIKIWDELVRSYVGYLIERPYEYEFLKIENPENAHVWYSLDFIVEDKNLKIVDSFLYELVEKKKQIDPLFTIKTRSKNDQIIKQKKSLFYDILWQKDNAWKLKRTTVSYAKGVHINYKTNKYDISEKKLLDAIQKTWAFEAFWVQIKTNKWIWKEIYDSMLTITNKRLQQYQARWVMLEHIISELEFYRNSIDDWEEKENITTSLNAYFKDLRRNNKQKEQIQNESLLIYEAFEKIFAWSFHKLDKAHQKAWYAAIFEKIELLPNKKLVIHLKYYIAKLITWDPIRTFEWNLSQNQKNT